MAFAAGIRPLPAPTAGVFHRYLDPIGNGYASTAGALKILNSIYRRSLVNRISGEIESSPVAHVSVLLPQNSGVTTSVTAGKSDRDRPTLAEPLPHVTLDGPSTTKRVAVASPIEFEQLVDVAMMELIEEQDQGALEMTTVETFVDWP